MINDVTTLLSMLDCMIDMVIVHDLEGNIIYANDALCKTTGYTRDELSSLNVRQISPEDKDLELETAFSGKKVACFERTGVRKDGTTFPYGVRIRLDLPPAASDCQSLGVACSRRVHFMVHFFRPHHTAVGGG